MKIYISGKISGLEIDAVEITFAMYEKQLKAHGFEVVNPLNLPTPEKPTWQGYMRNDIKALMDCDAVYAMPNWRDSIGARIEVGLARELNIPVYEKIGEIEEV